jgi:hypothetical protein
MSEAKLFVLAHPEARARAAAFMQAAPEGWRVECKPPKRGADINAALHARLGEIAERVEWAGKLRTIEVWKRLLVAAWMRETGAQVEMLPALDGHGVDIVYSPTSQMTQAQMRDLMGYVDAWAAERPELQQENA